MLLRHIHALTLSFAECHYYLAEWDSEPLLGSKV